MERVRYLKNFLIIIISIILASVTNLFSGQVYDLCFHGTPLHNGKFLFVRHKNALLDPVMRTFEIDLYDPYTGKITFLQRYGEKTYILPAVSGDRTTVCYHTLIDGNDFLVTRNIETGTSTQLRFDTSGYFVLNAIHYDNDWIASVLKRGENKQAIYAISNSEGSIKRIQNGVDFQEIGFLSNGSVYYVDRVGKLLILGVVRSNGRRRTVVAREVNYTKKTPRGDAMLYSVGSKLFLYRVSNNESIKITQNFSSTYQLPLIAEDGSTCAVLEKNKILLVNIPSGDILYYLSFDTEDTIGFLTNFTFYIAKDNRVFYIKHKKPGQYLTEVYRDEGKIDLLAVSPDDRYIIYRKGDRREIYIFDRQRSKLFSKAFKFNVEELIVSPYMDPSEAMSSIYIKALSLEPKSNLPLRELYLYNYMMRSLTAISTAEDTDIEAYLREE